MVPPNTPRPSAPALLAPPSGSSGQFVTPALSWSAVTDNRASGSYRIQIAPARAGLFPDPDISRCPGCVVNAVVSAPRATWRVFPLNQDLGFVPGTRASEAAAVFLR